MTPTNKLRFVERPIETHKFSYGEHVVNTIKVKILQQWWEPHYPGSAVEGEWRDVPLEEEE